MSERIIPPRQRLSLVLRVALLVLAAGVLIAPWLPWVTDIPGWTLLSSTHQNLRVAGQWWPLVLMPPTVVCAVLAALLRSMVAGRCIVFFAAIGTAGACYAAVRSAVDNTDLPGVGMGLALWAYPALFLVAVAAAVLVRRPAGPEHAIGSLGRVFAVLGTVVVLAAGIAVGDYWYVADRLVDQTVADAASGAHPSGPAGRVLWTASASGPDSAEEHLSTSVSAALAGGLVAVVDHTRTGVSVVDAATGTERWHYDRPGEHTMGMTASVDGRTVVLGYDLNSRRLLLGLDAATGTERWYRWIDDNLNILPNAAISESSADAPAFAGYDLNTGALRWSLPPSKCAMPVPQADAGLVVAVQYCPGSDPDASRWSEVRVLDSTNRTGWTSPSPTRPGAPDVSVLAIGADAVLAVWESTAGEEYTALDTATGRIRWSGTSIAGVQAVGDHVLLTRDGLDNQVKIVDAGTGEPRSNQPPTDLVPADSKIMASSIRDGRGYLLIHQDSDGGGATSLDVLDLASGRLLGSYPVSNLPLDQYNNGDAVTTQPGVVVVTADFNETTTIVAVRVPD